MIANEKTDHHEVESMEQLLDIIDPLVPPRFRGLSMSIYIEAGRTHEEALAARIRFKSAVLDRRAELRDEERYKEESAAMLDPAMELIDDRKFWDHQRGGLAYLATADGALSIQCACRFPTMSLFGGDYHLLPMLQAAATARRFYLLGLSEGAVFLRRVSDLGEEAVHGVPDSFAQALAHAGFQKSRIEEKEFSNQNNRATEHSLQALRVIDEAVRRAIPDQQDPLLVAAVEFVGDEYSRVCEYPNLVEARLEGDPERMPVSDLADEARRVMKPVFAASDRERGEHAAALLEANPSLTLTELPAIVRAASNANIASLTVAAGTDCLAGYSRGYPTRGDRGFPPHLRCDLVDFAARQTLTTGGELVIVGNSDLPADSPVIAETRWTPVNRRQ
ncbi:MAG: hypothetical protein HKO57_12670 [Akkermansiaceae bacterium]|nr:hypothetical protein [Akkermansiaceae bacterium]